jgi:ribonuclease HII
MDNFIEYSYFKDYDYLIGIDEAGRGPLAGPVLVGAVIIESLSDLKLLSCLGEDSKLLTPREREKRYYLLKRDFNCLSYSVSSQIIDKINILKATQIAMVNLLKNAINGNPHKYFTLVDGKFFKLPYQYECIIKGDRKSHLIGAASIIAKYERDTYMIDLHKIYPQYDFETNKGYPTKKHIENIKKYGIIPEHRTTFNPIKQFLKDGIIQDANVIPNQHHN